MAKKSKVSSKVAGGESLGCQYSPSMYIDFDSLKEVKGLSVGDEVRVVVKGTVKSIEQREIEKGKSSSSIRIEDFEAEIVPKSSEFDNLFDDENDD